MEDSAYNKGLELGPNLRPSQKTSLLEEEYGMEIVTDNLRVQIKRLENDMNEDSDDELREGINVAV